MAAPFVMVTCHLRAYCTYLILCNSLLRRTRDHWQQRTYNAVGLARLWRWFVTRTRLRARGYFVAAITRLVVRVAGVCGG